MKYYNEERTNQGRHCKGRTPMETFTEGVVKRIIYCPASAVSAALGHVYLGYCNPSKDSNYKIKGSRFGKVIYHNTADMRKADYLPLSQAIRKTSSCFETRGDVDDLGKAREQLVALKDSEIFALLPSQEKEEINAALVRLNNKATP